MNMNSVNMLLNFSFDVESIAPPNIKFWIDNNANQMITNTGAKIVFNVQ